MGLALLLIWKLLATIQVGTELNLIMFPWRTTYSFRQTRVREVLVNVLSSSSFLWEYEFQVFFLFCRTDENLPSLRRRGRMLNGTR